MCASRLRRRSSQRAADHGIPACDVVVDPLVMPIGAINQAGVQVMHLLRRLQNELKVNTTCGASNVSFGLPDRDGISAAFLTMAIGAGMTSAITNPLHLGDHEGLHGGGCHDGSRPGLRALDTPLSRSAGDGSGGGARGRRRRRAAADAKVGIAGAPGHRMARRTGRVHAFGQARPLPAGHAAAAGGARARRRH